MSRMSGSPISGTESGRRQPFREWKMVWVGVRHKHYANGRAGQLSVDGREVAVVVGPRVDDHNHRAGVDDPGVGAWTRVRPRIGRHHARD